MWALSAETLMTASFLKEGLRALERYLVDRDDFYPAALQLLGQGTEHLLKLTYILATVQLEGHPPTATGLKMIGHALPRLRDQLAMALVDRRLIDTADGEGFSRAALVLLSSPVNDYFLALLEDHGRSARYFYLEKMIGKHQSENPYDVFQGWFNEISEASRDLFENADADEFSPLQEHLIGDRPAQFLRLRKEVAYMHLLGFLSVTASVQLWLRADGWEGPLRPLTRIRTLRQIPKAWRV